VKKEKPEFHVIRNSEADALKAYFRRLYSIEKYIINVMLENDVQIQTRLLHKDTPRPYLGRVRFNGGIALGFNPYTRLPCTFYTPLGAIDLSKGFATREFSADAVARNLIFRLGLIETTPVLTAIPGIEQRVFIITRDTAGNHLPRASELIFEDPSKSCVFPEFSEETFSEFDNVHSLWDRVRLHEEPGDENIQRMQPRLRAVA
jgi:hypothetical protein